MTRSEFTGGCLCGCVRYRHAGPLPEVVACHCGQCRRTSGHFVAATQGLREALSFDSDEGLRWYESSPGIFRGFCVHCGSSLFWTREHFGRISIMAGTLDTPTHLRLTQHIHVADAGDYYRIDPALPQSPGGRESNEYPDNPQVEEK